MFTPFLKKVDITTVYNYMVALLKTLILENIILIIKTGMKAVKIF